jgi:flagellar protein FlaG
LPDRGTGTSNSTAADVRAAAPSTATTTAAAVPATQQSTAPVTNEEQLTQLVKEINKTLASMQQGIEFSIDPDSHRTIIRVVDQQTNELIKQIPSKEALQIAESLGKLQGVFIKQTA